jgi:ketosteroid isomerase-like protein
VLNLTNASSFSEFVAEIREDFVSTVLVTPEYEKPHALRYVECTLDIVRDYPELAGRRRWIDRAFYREGDGSVVPLSAYWEADGVSTGAWLLTLSRLFHSRPLRSAVRAALAAYP